MHYHLKKILMSVLGLSVFLGMVWASGSHKHKHGEKKEKKQHEFMVKGTQKVCPIRKEAIDPDVFIDYQGQRIYFCCPGCDKKFIKSSETYFSEMKKRGEVAESVQQICPVSGDKLEDHKNSLTLSGRKLYFCCKDCVKKFKKDKDNFLKKMMDPKAKQKDSHKGHDHSGHKH